MRQLRPAQPIGAFREREIEFQPLTGGDRKVIVSGGGFGRFSGNGKAGYLLYAEADSLVAVPFDLSRLETTGQPIVLGYVLAGGLGLMLYLNRFFPATRWRHAAF